MSDLPRPRIRVVRYTNSEKLTLLWRGLFEPPRRWSCSGSNVTMYGSTPAQAYRAWSQRVTFREVMRGVVICRNSRDLVDPNMV